MKYHMIVILIYNYLYIILILLTLSEILVKLTVRDSKGDDYDDHKYNYKTDKSRC